MSICEFHRTKPMCLNRFVHNCFSSTRQRHMFFNRFVHSCFARLRTYSSRLSVSVGVFYMCKNTLGKTHDFVHVCVHLRKSHRGCFVLLRYMGVGVRLGMCSTAFSACRGYRRLGVVFPGVDDAHGRIHSRPLGNRRGAPQLRPSVLRPRRAISLEHWVPG